MCRFKGRLEDEEVLFTESGANEQIYTVPRRSRGEAQGHVEQTQKKSQGSREISRRESDSEGKDEQKITGKM